MNCFKILNFTPSTGKGYNTEDSTKKGPAINSLNSLIFDNLKKGSKYLFLILIVDHTNFSN